jgi:hypothetical protein
MGALGLTAVAAHGEHRIRLPQGNVSLQKIEQEKLL